MSKYSAFYGRHRGLSKQEAIISSTKNKAYNYIMGSPSRRTVEYMGLVEQTDKTYKAVSMEDKYSIVSDKETFRKRDILFLPDEGVELGSYLKYDNKIYLATGISDVDIYPQAFVEHCNYELLIKGDKTKVIVDYDERGRPMYDYVGSEDYTIPCVITSKIYSALDNSQMPLPTGAIMVYVPYHKEIDIPINHDFQVYGDSYKVTTVSKSDLIKNDSGKTIGVLEIRGQREQGVDEK